MSGTNHQSPLDFKGTGNMDVVDNPEYAIGFIGHDQITVHAHSYMSDYN